MPTLYIPSCPKLAWSADAQFMAAVYQEAGLLPTDPGTLPTPDSSHMGSPGGTGTTAQQ